MGVTYPCGVTGWTGFCYPRVFLRSAPYIPKIYYNVISEEERIKAICDAIDSFASELAGCMTIDEFNAFLIELENQQNQQTKMLQDYADLGDENVKNELMAEIEKLQIGMLIWDVTIGKYNDGKEAMRNLYRWLSLQAATVRTLGDSELTVETLANSGLNVRGVAVYSGSLMGETWKPDGIYYQEGN